MLAPVEGKSSFFSATLSGKHCQPTPLWPGLQTAGASRAPCLEASCLPSLAFPRDGYGAHSFLALQGRPSVPAPGPGRRHQKLESSKWSFWDIGFAQGCRVPLSSGPSWSNICQPPGGHIDGVWPVKRAWGLFLPLLTGLAEAVTFSGLDEPWVHPLKSLL